MSDGHGVSKAGLCGYAWVPALEAFKPVFEIAQAPQDIASGLRVGKRLILAQIGGSSLKEFSDLLYKKIDSFIRIPHIQVHQGDALQIEFFDEKVCVFYPLGISVERPVDSVSNAGVRAAVVVEQAFCQTA